MAEKIINEQPLDNTVKELLLRVTGIKDGDFAQSENKTDKTTKKEIAFNIRQNGKAAKRSITKNTSITTNEKTGALTIDVKPDTKMEFIYIPAIVTQSGMTDIANNDFFIGKNAHVTIVAGCAIHNTNNKRTEHKGQHRFFLEEGAHVTYLEKHYGQTHGNKHEGAILMNPQTEIHMNKNSSMQMDTQQIKGIDSTIRQTQATLQEGANLSVTEKIHTHKEQYAETSFTVDLNGKGSSVHVVSRSISSDKSYQKFISKIHGNTQCYGHVECDGIIMDQGRVTAIPEITANSVDAELVHEAAIGKIAGAQLTKLMTLGLTEKEAEEQIIKGFLS
ncbi:MAG TPA: SufD family Fe-S cluster assembly protein [Treponemataceae bacterium]|nr:SufD family Fe-S cluster assembly protein [Treponemataceae bacterium]